MRVRLRFTKLGKLRFLGHRDLARCWERAIRKAEVPIAYSEGFSPRPRLHFGLALPTGCESEAEYLDIDLRDEVGVDIDVAALPAVLSAAMPRGIDVEAAAQVADHADSLQSVVESVTWRFEIVGATSAEVSSRVAALLAATDLPLTFERKGKQVTENVRPVILAADLAVTASDPPPTVGGPAGDGCVTLVVELATRPRSIRPNEFLAVFEPPLEARRICRVEQWTTIDGARRPPLGPVDPSRPGVLAQAS